MSDNISAFNAMEYVDVVNIQFHRPMTRLDIGCGTGKMIEIVKNRFEKIPCITASIFDLCDNMQFDVVTAIQVFHNLQKQERLEAIKRCYTLSRAA